MPNSLSQADQELYDTMMLFVESLIYAANYNYMNQPGSLKRKRSGRENFVQRLRVLLTPLIPASHIVNSSDPYRDMRSLINSLRTTISDNFTHDPAKRKKNVDDFAYEMFLILVELNCGDLCPDKEKGCVEC